MQKNVASQKVQLFAFDITTGAPKTGDAANLTAYVSKDHGAVTVLGDTSATEMDATNAKGVYVFDLTQAETNADELTFTAKSSTANVSITPRFVSTTAANFTAQSIDSNGRVDVIKVAGTTQTAGDIIGDTNDIQTRLPAALVSGRMDSSVGAMAADVLTAAATAADFTTEIQAGLATAANLATVAGYLDTEIAAILADTNELQADWANGGRLDLILDARASQTSVDELPTNAELATALGTADDAVLAQVALVKAKTDNLPSDPADASDVAAAVAAVKIYADRTVVRGTVSGTSPTTTTFTSSALSPVGVATDQFKGRIIVFDNDTTTTALRGQATDITASSAASNPLFTFTALTTAPQSGDTFSIL